ncbi:hypothetical protein pb186bvf_017566 [Paramecium bursaria]
MKGKILFVLSLTKVKQFDLKIFIYYQLRQRKQKFIYIIFIFIFSLRKHNVPLGQETQKISNRINNKVEEDEPKEVKKEKVDVKEVKDLSPTKESKYGRQNHSVKEKEGKLSQIKHHLEEAKEFLDEKANDAKKVVKQKMEKLDKSIQNALINQKDHLNQWVSNKVDKKAISILAKVEPKLTKTIQKSVPYDLLKTIANDAVVHLWKDISDLIRFELKLYLDPPRVDIPFVQPSNWKKIQSFVVYSLYPADLTQRQHMRRIGFYLMKGLQMVYFYGIQSFVFLLIFLCIDKKDEYQLVNFIVDMKSIQFVSFGFVGCFLGYFMYFMTSLGPGQHHHSILIIASLAIEISIMWISFLLLRQSDSKQLLFSDQIQIDRTVQGGRIVYFMIYDFVIQFFVISLGLLIYFLDIKPQISELLYFCKCIYGLLSIPFVIFLTPFFIRILTNAMPSGYDKYGNCIPTMNKVMVYYKSIQSVETDDDKIDLGEVLGVEEEDAI